MDFLDCVDGFIALRTKFIRQWCFFWHELIFWMDWSYF